MPDDLSSKPDKADGPILTRRSLLIGGAAGAALLYGAGPAGATRSLSRAFNRTSGRNGHLRLERLGRGAQEGRTRTCSPTSRRRRASGVKVNTVDHNTFQEQINSYLQGKPDDVFTWFAGYRMQFFAQKGLATDDRRRVEDARRRYCRRA